MIVSGGGLVLLVFAWEGIKVVGEYVVDKLDPESADIRTRHATACRDELAALRKQRSEYRQKMRASKAMQCKAKEAKEAKKPMKLATAASKA